ncbi:hypothetical protein OA007_02950, partial [SAR116 cluster bacterium]|nr:hypothetical protein [SAR116 cluster bacterium]
IKTFFVCLFSILLSSTTSAQSTEQSQKLAFIKGCVEGAREASAAGYQWKFKDKEMLSTRVVAALTDFYDFTSLMSDYYCELIWPNFLQNSGHEPQALLDQMLSERQEHGYSTTAAQLRKQAQDTMLAKGLKRLDARRVRPYFYFMNEVFVNSSEELCSDIWLTTITPINLVRAMSKVEQLAPDEVVVQYYAMMKDAITAEKLQIRDTLPKSKMDQRAVAEAFTDHLLNYSSFFPDRDNLLDTLDNNPTTPAVSYCELGKLWFGAFATMQGDAGDDARNMYFHIYH